MSGICGIVNLDGTPVAAGQVREMTAFLAFRGPDAQEHWSSGCAGLGHTMLRSTDDATHERQPASLDGQVWICADARIDARGALKDELAARGNAVAAAVTDAQLILHAYAEWGEDCVAHLLGDFAFAIWDAPRQRLFCARDHFGVKPFFHAHVGHALVFGNTLDGVRRHPRVSSELDDLAIADFLLFEMNQDPAATSFRDIRRLPPAHCLTAGRGGVRVREYWKLPLESRVRYRAAGDYVEHFRELLQVAVTDRLRTARVGVELSGGLDSTSIAATALAALSRTGQPYEMNALAIVYNRLIPDEEGRYARMVAEKLGIPLHYFVSDDFGLYADCERPQNRLPEPSNDPGVAATLDVMRREASFGRVVLTGWDGDALFNESPKPYFRSLFRELRWGRLAAGLVRYAISQRRIVPLAWLGASAPAADGALAEFPAWIEPALEARLRLRERWRQAIDEPVVTHPIRPYAFRVLASVMRASNFFEYSDAGVTGVALEHRHPLMDLRLQEFCLSLPPLPWCVKKEIMRQAMRGVLPEAVLLRPKTPLAGWPEMQLLHRPEARWIDAFAPAPGLARYVDRARIPPVCAQAADDQSSRERRWRDLRPLSLSVWMRNLENEHRGKTNRLHETSAMVR